MWSKSLMPIFRKETKVYDELFGGDGCAKIVENNGFLTYMLSSLAALAAQHIEFSGILLKFY
jgi:hypothetical protein